MNDLNKLARSLAPFGERRVAPASRRDFACKASCGSLARVAIVTGSSRGIGRAIANRLVQDGATVIINYSHSADKADAAVKEIEQGGGKAIAIQADVSQVTDLERLFDDAIDKLGKVDILVNCAGVVVYKPIVEVTEADFDKIMAVNVKGTYFACQQAAKKMADAGRIVNISSTTTALMLPTYSAYVASKGAVEQISRVLCKELGDRQITVNIVSPGPTDTPLFRKGKTEEQIKHFGDMAALGRIAQVEDIARQSVARVPRVEGTVERCDRLFM